MFVLSNKSSIFINLADFTLNLMQRHIRIALDLHKSNAKAAFGNFSNWINEGVDEIQFTKQLYEKVCIFEI